MVKNNKNKIKTPPPAKPTGVEFYFGKYAEAHQSPVNKFIQVVFIPLMLFGLFGLLWAIPFPYIKFLGKYNNDFNWSSFFLAAIVYYYIKQSPALAYVVLLVLLIYSFLVTQLAQWQKQGGPALWAVCGGIFVLSAVTLYMGYKKEGKKLSFEYRYKNILIAPLFLVRLMFRRFSIRY